MSAQQQTLTIDPEKALELLDQACASIQTNRQGHEVLAVCLQVLRQRIVSDQQTIADMNVAISSMGRRLAETLPEGENASHVPADYHDPSLIAVAPFRAISHDGKLYESPQPENASQRPNGAQQSVQE